METNIWVELAKLVVVFLGGGGLWAWIKAREDKRKTPYDILRGRFNSITNNILNYGKL